MKKCLVLFAVAALIFVSAGVLLAVDVGDLSDSEIKNLVSLSKQIGDQQQALADLKGRLISTTTALVVLLVLCIGFMLFMMKLVSNKHKGHIHQQIHNYHHAHHKDSDFDHSYVHHHHHHST